MPGAGSSREKNEENVTAELSEADRELATFGQLQNG